MFVIIRKLENVIYSATAAVTTAVGEKSVFRANVSYYFRILINILQIRIPH